MRGLRLGIGGSVVVETAFVVPLYLMLLLGIVAVGLYGYLSLNLHWAAYSAARCAAIGAGSCNSPTATQSYAQSQLIGPSIDTSFTYQAAACGSLVTGTATLGFNLGAMSLTLPLSASSCVHTND